MENLNDEHKAKFGVEPNIIGMYWNDPAELMENILEAIETNKPYDEYKLLTKEEQKAFDKGELLF